MCHLLSIPNSMTRTKRHAIGCEKGSKNSERAQEAVTNLQNPKMLLGVGDVVSKKKDQNRIAAPGVA